MHKDKKQGLVIIVVGGMFGSEGKGRHVEVLTRYKCPKPIDIAVRTGAPNAGHTVYYEEKPYAMQQIPCSWIDKDCQLVLGAGAQIDLHLLKKEIDMLGDMMDGRIIYVDKNAIIQDESCMKSEQDLGMHSSIGSTAEGCGVALQRRIARDGSIKTAEQFGEASLDLAVSGKGQIKIIDVAEYLNDEYDCGKTILLEGTQGAGLSLYHTPDYPKATSRDTNAANWLSEAGLSPRVNCEVHMVMRSYPIRVAGKSGYMPNEISWPYFLRQSFSGVNENAIQALEDKTKMMIDKATKGEIIWNDVIGKALEAIEKQEYKDELKKHIEITTVTKKARRISTMDFDFFKKYIKINRPDLICLQFADYLDRKTCSDIVGLNVDTDLIEMSMDEIETKFNFNLRNQLAEYKKLGCQVKYLGIGKTSTIRIV